MIFDLFSYQFFLDIFIKIFIRLNVYMNILTFEWGYIPQNMRENKTEYTSHGEEKEKKKTSKGCLSRGERT